MLTSTCQYKKEDNIIRNRIIFVIFDVETKNKLLSLDNPKLGKADTVCQGSRTRKATDKEIQELTPEFPNVYYMGRE